MFSFGIGVSYKIASSYGMGFSHGTFMGRLFKRATGMKLNRYLKMSNKFNNLNDS
jgi:hypothetical protein